MSNLTSYSMPATQWSKHVRYFSGPTLWLTSWKMSFQSRLVTSSLTFGRKTSSSTVIVWLKWSKKTLNHSLNQRTRGIDIWNSRKIRLHVIQQSKATFKICQRDSRAGNWHVKYQRKLIRPNKFNKYRQLPDVREVIKLLRIAKFNLRQLQGRRKWQTSGIADLVKRCIELMNYSFI